MISYILAIICGILVLAADQISKFKILDIYADNTGKSYDFIKGIVDITFTRNGGAAWGMLDGKTWLLISLTIVVITVCIVLLIKMGLQDKFMFWAICLVISGGLGNLIDRIFRGGLVVDFLHFTFWPSFPIFNIADCAVVIGASLLIIYYIKSTLKDLKKTK